MSTKDDLKDIWIRSYPNEKGHYGVVIEVGQDRTFPMDAVAAYAWAREVLSAVAAAEYDAAVIRQMHHLGLDDHGAASVVSQIRADRAEEVPLSMIPGLSMKSGVSARTRQGFLLISLDGEAFGQWDMDQAREHALALLTAVEVAVLDAAYLRALLRTGLNLDLALRAIAGLSKYRDDADDASKE